METYPDGVLWTDLIGEVHFGRLNLSRAPDEPYRPTPERGEHTDEILAEFGYDADAIAGLRDAGAV